MKFHNFFFLGYGILSSSDRISSAPMCAILNDRSLSSISISIIITYRPKMPLLKPELADGAVAGKDSPGIFWAH